MKVAVIGTGYVGLVTGACLSEKGHSVICVDKNENIVNKIKEGISPIHEPGLEELLVKNLQFGRLTATKDTEEAILWAEIIIIAVGTPSKEDGSIDLKFILEVSRDIGAALKKKKDYCCVIVKSTVVPGTTVNDVLPLLESNSAKKIGDFGLGMNPEFLREGSAVTDFMNPDRIIIGAMDELSLQYMEELYSQFDAPKILTSPTTAELTKYANNALLATLISFSNEIGLLAASLPDVDIRDVLHGLHFDGRWSPIIKGEKIYPDILKYIWAGCGYGGSCFPKDVSSLEQFGVEMGIETPLIKMVQQVNRLQPLNAVRLLEQCSSDNLKGKKVGVLGLAFKPNTDDVRETPAFAIIKELLDRDALVIAHDPLSKARTNFVDTYIDRLNGSLQIVQDFEEVVKSADFIFIVTSWPEYIEKDWKALVEKHDNIKIFFDGRRSLEPSVFFGTGCKYCGIGYGNWRG
jgi:UDPglucose 6-dehydrogenase/GDP-mannose 6-dehydrogenase